MALPGNATSCSGKRGSSRFIVLLLRFSDPNGSLTMDSLAGKVIIITGASEGIGACLAAALRKRGANLCLTARNMAGPDSDLIVPGDVTMDSVRSGIVARTVERWGKIDILINN